MISVVKSFSDIVKCDKCNNQMPRVQTLILQTPKGKFRLCRDCYNAYAKDKLSQEYQEAKKNVKLYGINFTDEYDIIKKKEKFIKDIKEGRI